MCDVCVSNKKEDLTYPAHMQDEIEEFGSVCSGSKGLS